MKKYLKIVGSILIFCGIYACNERVKYSGTVLSRHMVPMPNVVVNIPIWYDGSSHGASPLSGSTDKDGKFNISGNVCHNCYGSEVNVRTADSGYVEHQSIINKTTDIQVILN